MTTTTEAKKNPAAVALGKLGARQGGIARAAALTAKERSEIARKGGENRWKNRLYDNVQSISHRGIKTFLPSQI